MTRDKNKSTTARIGIVGGGAAGVLVAVNLMREVNFPLEILLIDQHGEFGPGIPYRTRNPEHRLNVPAARMSALADEPDHFLEWMRERSPETPPDSFVSRGIYGEYLKELLEAAENASSNEVALNRVTETVTAVERSGSGWRLLFDGWQTKVHQVVIATGPIAGGDPVVVPDSLRERGVYIRGAWDESAVLPARGDDEVLVIGTGLTMVDVSLTLTAGSVGPKIRAVSRSGLVPRAHRRGLTSLHAPELPTEGPLSVRDLLAAFTRELGRATLEGGDWRDAIDSMRSVTPNAWRRIPTQDKQQFLTEMNRVWEVHRYRMAPEVAERFDESIQSGRLKVTAARIGSIEDTGTRARVTLLADDGAEVAEFDRVIAACGAETDIRSHAPAPIDGLLASGDIKPDDLNMGIEVDADGAARDADGNRSPGISVIGSLRRGVDWETIGITELRRQSAEISNRIALESAPTKRAAATETGG